MLSFGQTLSRRLPRTPLFLADNPTGKFVVCEVAAIIALSEEGDIWRRPSKSRRFADTVRAGWRQPSGDHMTLLVMWRMYRQQAAKFRGMNMSKTETQQLLEAWCDKEYVKLSAFQAAERT